MQQLIIKHITEEEIFQQKEIKHRLISAILSENVSKIDDLLDPKGCYFGKFTRGQAMIYLIKKFNKVKISPGRVNMEINHGYSFDHLPKQDVIEFRFSIFGSDFINGQYNPPYFGLAERPQFNEGVIHLALEFKDNKIYSIRHPKKIIKDFGVIARRN